MKLPAGAEHLSILLPSIVLVGGALLLMLMDAARPHGRGAHLALLTGATLAGAVVAYAYQWNAAPARGLAQMVVRDRFGVIASWIVLAAALLTTIISHAYMRARALDRAEYYALLLLCTTGMTLLVQSADLIMVFLSIELLSLALYVMAGLERTRPDAQEASMKYFLLGAFASAFLLYGIAFVYGASGTTNLLKLRESLLASGPTDFRLLAIAVVLLAVGLGFKAALVPFHMWTPDVYQGAPTPVTAFMAAATKAAAFAAVVRIFVSSMNVLRWDWRPVMAALSVLTVVFASVIAIAQTDLKRMLAYSSVAHAGFLGIAVVASSRTGVAAVILYLIVYTAQTMGAFGCLMLFKEGEGERVHLAKYSGLGSRHPAAAALFAFFLFSLAGIPPTGGFFGKFYVFVGAIGSGYAWLAVVGVLASVVAAFFYVRVAVVMFMQEADPADEMPLERSAGLRLALGVCAATLVAVALAPGFFIALAEKAVSFA